MTGSATLTALRLGILLSWALLAFPSRSHAQRPAGAPANRAVYLDKQGVIRWKDDRRELALFGANYVLPTASDYRAAGYVKGGRKRMIDEDMAGCEVVAPRSREVL